MVKLALVMVKAVALELAALFLPSSATLAITLYVPTLIGAVAVVPVIPVPEYRYVIGAVEPDEVKEGVCELPLYT